MFFQAWTLQVQTRVWFKMFNKRDELGMFVVTSITTILVPEMCVQTRMHNAQQTFVLESIRWSSVSRGAVQRLPGAATTGTAAEKPKAREAPPPTNPPNKQQNKQASNQAMCVKAANRSQCRCPGQTLQISEATTTTGTKHLAIHSYDVQFEGSVYRLVLWQWEKKLSNNITWMNNNTERKKQQ